MFVAERTEKLKKIMEYLTNDYTMLWDCVAEEVKQNPELTQNINFDCNYGNLLECRKKIIKQIQVCKTNMGRNLHLETDYRFIAMKLLDFRKILDIVIKNEFSVGFIKG